MRDSAGITIVENDHSLPAWGEGEEWRLSNEPVLRIGSVSGDPTGQLYEVGVSTRLSDGAIAVANGGAAEVRVYGSDGSFERAIGRRGQGPGEFRVPEVVHQIDGDSILVIDFNRSAPIQVFDRRGSFSRMFDRPRPDGAISGGVGHVGQFEDGTLLFKVHFPTGNDDPASVLRTRVEMVRVGLSGRSLGVLGGFADEVIELECCLIFKATPKEAVSDTTLWYGPGDRLELREVAHDGRVLRLVRLDEPARPITESDISAVGQPPDPGTYDIRAPEFFPYHLELLADSDRNLWVQEYPLPGAAQTWYVFDPRGRYMGRVRTPEDFTVHEIGSDYVLGRWTDEMDVEYVDLYSLEKPDGS